MSLPAGADASLADAAEDLALREVEVAHFERDDILPPGRGFCFFGKVWRDDSLAAVDAVFFEQRRPAAPARRGARRRSQLAGEARHGACRADAAAARGAGRRRSTRFKRVCRPRFAGVDTLSGTPAPIAAAFDAVLQAPDGALLAIGWLLDPLRRVERVLIKSTRQPLRPARRRLVPAAAARPRPRLRRRTRASPTSSTSAT